MTRSTLGLLHIIFRTFVPELRPLIFSKNWFPINIMRTNGQILTKLYITIFYIRKCVRELWPLIEVRITLQLNILRHSGLLLHARHCSGAIVRFSDNSSYDRYSLGCGRVGGLLCCDCGSGVRASILKPICL